VLDLDANEEEIDLSHNHILQMVSGISITQVFSNHRSVVQHESVDLLGLVIFEFDVQAVLDTDFHLDGVVAIWWHAK
jgi:hypothetical protein